MITGVESLAFLKPAVKYFMDGLNKLTSNRLKDNAQQQLNKAIRELLLENPDVDSVDSAIELARAAGVINSDLFLAERLRASVAKARYSVARKSKVSVKRKSTAKRKAKRKAKK